MIDYTQWDSVDLVKAVEGRGLEVRRGKNHHLQSIKGNCIAALKRADRNFTLPFMKLTPELRNIIYRELLVFDSSSTCYPQIIATCKSIQKEASTIMYGENWFDVKIYHDCVQAHGHRCGRYNPGARGHHEQERLLTSLRWPKFLRQAQWIRCTVVHVPYSNLDAARTVNHILYSLCSFLESNNCLRVFCLDTTNLGLGATGSQWLPVTCYPLGLLGELDKIEVIADNGEGVRVENARLTFAGRALAVRSALTPALELLSKIALYEAMQYRVSSLDGVASVRDEERQVYVTNLRGTPGIVQRLLEDSRWFEDKGWFDRSWEDSMRKAVSELKKVLNTKRKNDVELALEGMMDRIRIQLAEMRQAREAKARM